eukprot:scaffold1379_cov209-Alexandrium_tamarense.AAC.17
MLNVGKGRRRYKKWCTTFRVEASCREYIFMCPRNAYAMHSTVSVPITTRARRRWSSQARSRLPLHSSVHRIPLANAEQRYYLLC